MTAPTVLRAPALRSSENANQKLSEQGDRVTAITPTLFQIDSESQVEFIRDPKGAVSKVRLLWNDGWVDTIARTTRP